MMKPTFTLLPEALPEPEAALEPAGWLLLSPQAARQSAMVRASSNARNFFILIFPPSNILAKRQAGIAELTPLSYHTGLWGEIQLNFFIFFDFFPLSLSSLSLKTPGTGPLPLPFSQFYPVQAPISL